MAAACAAYLAPTVAANSHHQTDFVFVPMQWATALAVSRPDFKPAYASPPPEASVSLNTRFCIYLK